MLMTTWRYGVKVPEGSPWEGYAQELKSVILTKSGKSYNYDKQKINHLFDPPLTHNILLIHTSPGFPQT